MALCPTTALREPWNYGLRGWISTRSNDLARVLLKVNFQSTCGRPFLRADRAAFPAIRRECVGGVGGGGRGARSRRGGFGATAKAVGNHAAGSRHAGDGKHHQLP